MIIKNSKNQLHRNFLKKLVDAVVHYGKYFLGLLIVLTVLSFLVSRTVFFNPVVLVKPEKNFFQGPVKISLESVGVIGQSEIRYTTDGGRPTGESHLYRQPLEISDTTVLKAAIFKDQQPISSITTHDVFIQAEHTLPLVSIVTQPENLWDPEIGIYVTGNDEENRNFEQRGEEWQRPAVFHFYESNRELVVKQKIGLRIHGGGSRELPQKTLRLYADVDDPQAVFSYDFFPNSGVSQFKTLLLRNAGGDWEKSFMRDVIVSRIAAKKSELDYMVDRPVVVYLNGRYWGIHYLRDRFDKEYIHQKFGLDPSRISLLEVLHDVGENRGEVIADESRFEDDAKLYNKLLEDASVCRDCASYSYFDDYLDMGNLIDYFIFEIHFANYDWPFGNTKLWRYHNTLVDRNPKVSSFFPPGLDGRFRWYLYDMDVAFAFNKDIQEDIIDSAVRVGYDRLIDDEFPFRNLFYDRAFQENYFNRYANFLNTTFSPAEVNYEIDKLIKEIGSEMPRHIERWKDEKSSLGITFPQSYDAWMDQVDKLRLYVEHRPDGMRDNSLEKFSGTFQGYRMVNLEFFSNDKEGGDIKIHKTIIPGEKLPFSGQYFPNIYLTVEALPHSGYRFVGWDGDVSERHQADSRLRFKLDEDYRLQANFEKNNFLWFN